MSSQFLRRPEGALAYDLAGAAGPLVICAPGMGDLRSEYRFLAPPLVTAGYRVATVDLRGHGESSGTFRDHTPEAIGADLVALANELSPSEPVFIAGTSMAAAAAVWAAAEAPARVAGIILLGPFIRDITPTPLQRFLLWLLMHRPWGPWAWSAYYRSLYPTAPPAALRAHRRSLVANLRQPGRFEALRAMMAASKAACEARIAEVRAPALVVMGTRDPDFADPVAEANTVAARLSGELLVVNGAGHYPHAERPDVVAPAVRDFIARFRSRAAAGNGAAPSAGGSA